MYNGKNHRNAFQAAQLKTRTSAPPVYRPNPVPKVCQLKTTNAGPVISQPQKTAARLPHVGGAAGGPKAPAVYRPQPTPKVLQRTVARNTPRGATVIQRNIDSTYFEKSAAASPMYMVNPAAREVLYSHQGAPPPRPRGLYTKRQETDDADGSRVFAWQPNVRFLSRQEAAFNEKTFTYQGDLGPRRLDLPGLLDQTENPAQDITALESPTFGIIGKNDCGRFAQTLYSSIARDYYRDESDEPGEIFTKANTKAEYPQISVGDMMLHRFDKGSCGWHGTTVVAEDGQRQVTLEADVSKERIHPHFHIYKGVRGFVKYNKQDTGDRSKRVEVTQYVRGKPEEKDLKNFQVFKTDPGSLGSTLGTSRNPQHAFRPLGRLLRNKKWDSEGEVGLIDLFAFKTPDGIVKMRAAYNKGNYWEVFKIAEEKNAVTDWSRSALTRALYRDLTYIGRQLRAATKQQLPDLLDRFMGELSTWFSRH